MSDIPLHRLIWGKTLEQAVPGQPTWLPALDHMIDTGEVAALLWDTWMSEPMKASIGGSRKHYVFAAAVHDLGKLTPAFSVGREESLACARTAAMREAGFSYAMWPGTGSRPRHEVLTMTMLLPTLLAAGWNSSLALNYLSAPGSHHGFTPTSEDLVAARRGKQEDARGVDDRVWEAAQAEGLAALLERFPVPAVRDFTRAELLALAGAVTLADWLASSYGPMNDGAPYDENRAASILTQLWDGPAPQAWRPEMLEPAELAKRRFPLPGGAVFGLREAQQVVVDTVTELETPGLIIVEAPPGEGKTEAALLAAEMLSARFGFPGFVFALPTMATTSKMWTRVLDWSRVAELPGGTTAFLGFSKAMLDTTYQELLQNRQHDLDVVASQFFSRRMGLHSRISVATIDQVLPLGLKHKYLPTVSLALSDKIVIIDEVHSYDAFMNVFLRQSLAYLGERGVPVMLLSATLSQSARAELMEAYLGHSDTVVPQGYPLISAVTTAGQVLARTFTPVVTGRRIELGELDDDPTALREAIKEAVEAGAEVAVIRSTVKRAQATFLLLRDLGVPIMLLHSRFTAADRERQEKALDSLYGKSGDRPGGSIVVSTQIIEQSLDVDFDVMFSDVAPVDLLIQRVGRLWRHERASRPVEVPRLVLTGIAAGDIVAEDSSHEFIYAPSLLRRTVVALRAEGGVLALPERISSLIERVYADEVLEGYESLNVLRARDLARSDSKAAKARVVSVASPTLTAIESQRATKGLLEKVNLKTEAGHGVRDINDTLEAVLLVRRPDGLHRLGRMCLVEVPEVGVPVGDAARDLMRESLRLPQLYKMTDSARLMLEKNRPLSWSRSLLRSALVIIADDDLRFVAGGRSFRYDRHIGLVEEGKD